MLLIGVTVLVGARTNPSAVIVASFLATMLAVSTPLALGAMCGIFSERSGIVNIAIEGLMLTAAFFGITVAMFAQSAGLSSLASLVTGVAAAVVVSVLLSLLHALLSITFRVDQVISGTVINMLAIGLTGFLHQQIVFRGLSLASAGVLPAIRIPILASLPVMGAIFRQQPIAIIALVYPGASAVRVRSNDFSRSVRWAKTSHTAARVKSSNARSAISRRTGSAAGWCFPIR